METIIGSYKKDFSLDRGHIRLQFYPDRFPIKWAEVSNLSNFITNYIVTHLPTPTSGEEHYMDQKEVVGITTYALNELFENAIKFNTQGEINVSVGIEDEELVFLLTNCIPMEKVARLQEELKEIVEGDVMELFMTRVERNFEEGTGTSGLGILSLVKDFDTVLGWKFEPADNTESVVLNTMGRLSFKKS